jgi:ABC-type multidrug transport system fused ATPase/permease subunit
VRSKRSKETQVASIVQENMSSMGVVQAFAQEDAEQRRFRQESRQGLEAGLRGARYGKAFREVVKVLTAAGTALVVWYGARLALGGQVTPGDLIVFASYARNLYTPIGSLSELIVDFMESLVAGERLLEIARIQSQIRDAPHAAPAPAFRGEVEFRGIVAGYQEGQPVLRNLSFRAAPGQTVALIGSSGAGKSTVLNLLLRFIDPWQGAILIDGHDIRGFRLRSLRSRISVVPQDPVLFQRSIRENIAYGKPEARFTEIVRAAQAAQAHEFIGSLPAGYDTVLGERGERISGGQRQRITLARAILLDAPILVLDEPSSALDAITEAQLRQTLRGHLKGKTVFVIAHRLSTMQDADLILVLEEGQAVEQGSHEELLVRSPLYQRYHHAQSGALRK